jgi:hypothetical protein
MRTKTTLSSINYSAGLRLVPEKQLAARCSKYLKLMQLDRFRDRLIDYRLCYSPGSQKHSINLALIESFNQIVLIKCFLDQNLGKTPNVR